MQSYGGFAPQYGIELACNKFKPYYFNVHIQGDQDDVSHLVN